MDVFIEIDKDFEQRSKDIESRDIHRNSKILIRMLLQLDIPDSTIRYAQEVIEKIDKEINKPII